MEQLIRGTVISNHYERLFERYPMLEDIKEEIRNAYELIENTYENGGKLLVCGNGGSAADSEHIVGELMKGFYHYRPLIGEEKQRLGDLAEKLQGALPAIALTGHCALSTAFLNDVDPEMVFAQQVYGYGQVGDSLLALSTSGNSTNVVNAVKVAKKKGMKVISFVGGNGGQMKVLSDVMIRVPAQSTADIQEFHLPVYHTLCAMLEEHFFPEN